MSGKHPSAIGETLKAYFARHGLIRRVRQASVINEWADIVGDQVAAVTEPDSVAKDGTLRVRVRSAAWMQELQLMSPTIVRQLGQRGKSIKRIHWMLGSFEHD